MQVLNLMASRSIWTCIMKFLDVTLKPLLIIMQDVTASSRKPKLKKKGRENTVLSSGLDASECQDAVIAGFCEILEYFCGRAEVFSDEPEKREFLPLSAADVIVVVNEIIPADILVRLLRVIDHQIHHAEGLSINDCEHGIHHKKANATFQDTT